MLTFAEYQSWCKNDIDRHVLANLEELGLSPNPPASKENLVRRASLDLRGVPPTISEIDTFLQDDSENAYEQMLDRFLSDPACGERLAVEWLDVASYGDSQGLFSDLPNLMRGHVVS